MVFKENRYVLAQDLISRSTFAAAQFAFQFLQKNLQWQVVYSNLKHDFHAVGEEVDATYPENRRLTTEEIDEVKMLQKEFRLSNAAIARALSKKTGKIILPKQIFNLKLKGAHIFLLLKT